MAKEDGPKDKAKNTVSAYAEALRQAQELRNALQEEIEERQEALRELDAVLGSKDKVPSTGAKESAPAEKDSTEETGPEEKESKGEDAPAGEDEKPEPKRSSRPRKQAATKAKAAKDDESKGADGADVAEPKGKGAKGEAPKPEANAGDGDANNGEAEPKLDAEPAGDTPGAVDAGGNTPDESSNVSALDEAMAAPGDQEDLFAEAGESDGGFLDPSADTADDEDDDELPF